MSVSAIAAQLILISGLFYGAVNFVNRLRHKFLARAGFTVNETVVVGATRLIASNMSMVDWLDPMMPPRSISSGGRRSSFPSGPLF